MDTVTSHSKNNREISYQPIVDGHDIPDAYASLLLAADKRIEKLMQENRAITIERDSLKKRIDAQSNIIKTLKTKSNPNTTAPQDYQKQDIQLNDLPEIDASEFLPVNDVQLLTDREQTIQAVKKGVGKTVSHSVSTTGTWLLKKTVSILT